MRLTTALLAAIWVTILISCEGGGTSTSQARKPTPPPTTAPSRSVELVPLPDPCDKATCTQAFWENANYVMQGLFQLKENPRSYHPTGLPPRLKAAAYHDVAAKLDNLSARGVDEDALNAWSRVSAACKSMAAFEDYISSPEKMFIDFSKGVGGDINGVIGDATSRMDSVAKEFQSAEAEVLRVRRLLESRYGTEEFSKPRIY